MLDLTNVALVAITGHGHRLKETQESMARCLRSALFGEVHLVSPNIKSNAEYCNWMIHNLHACFDRDFVLTIHWDSWIVNPAAWTDEFFKFDYIGAAWPAGMVGRVPVVGNSGFSLKSRRLAKAQAEVYRGQYIPLDDTLMSLNDRAIFEGMGMRWASVSLAHRFSVEHFNWDTHRSFGFHGAWHVPRFAKMFDDQLLEELSHGGCNA